MKKLIFILCALSFLSACVFNIKVPPEEKTQTPVEETDATHSTSQ